MAYDWMGGAAKGGTQAGAASGGNPWLIGLGALGGAASGAAEAAQQQAQLAQNNQLMGTQGSRGFEIASRQAQLGESGLARQLGLDMSNAPLRDRILFNLQARMGMTPQAFQPRDMFNPQAVGNKNMQVGGLDWNKYTQAMNAYQPGAGGVTGQGGTLGLTQQLLRTMGYGQDNGGQWGYQGPRGFSSEQDLLNRDLIPGQQNYSGNMKAGVIWDPNKGMFVPQNAPTYAGQPPVGATRHLPERLRSQMIKWGLNRQGVTG